MGGLTIGLALGGALGRGGPPWRTWLVFVALASLAASCGRFAGPLWWARWLPAAESLIGPRDPLTSYFRPDGFLEDGFGSPYSLLTAAVPGFSAFRYPGKLLAFTALALSVLAALGWDLLASGRTRWPARWCGWGLALTLVSLVLWITLGQSWVARALGSAHVPDPQFGPLDLPAALDATRRSMIHGAAVLGVGLALAKLAPRWPAPAGAAALVVLALDLGLANAGLIWSVPQSAFDAPSEAARRIAAHEAREPAHASGPFRIHRLPDWMPNAFARQRSPGRLAAVVAWERDTLEPLFGLPLGFEYGLVQGNMELLDYLVFFRPTTMPARGAMAALLGVAEGTPVLYIPRRAFDLWNDRYFLVPINSDGWTSRERGFAMLLPETELIHPSAAVFAARGPDSWRERADWMLLKNKAAFPRAWLVHFARVRKPVSNRRLQDHPDAERLELLQDLLYGNDPFWSDPSRPLFDLHQMAFVETDDPSRLAGLISRTPVEPTESVTITRYEPQRVELTAVMNHAGLVILADAFYPGWRLTIDGAEAPIYRTNHAMRGAAVAAGTHRLVYTYEPDSFRYGVWLSLAGAAALAALTGWTAMGSHGGRHWLSRSKIAARRVPETDSGV
jgi:hypothetical protein